MAKAPPKRTKRRSPVAPRRLTLRISLRDVSPVVWREISVPDSFTLEQLHRCIQLVFDWLDYHLYEFQVGSRRFERPDPDAEGENASAVRLADLSLETGSSFLYLYDMGDGWAHDVIVRASEAGDKSGESDPLAYVVDGARAAPPEDVGGAPAYEQLVAAFRQRSRSSAVEILEWAGPGFDPELFDRRASNHSLVLASAWGVI